MGNEDYPVFKLLFDTVTYLKNELGPHRIDMWERPYGAAKLGRFFVELKSESGRVPLNRFCISTVNDVLEMTSLIRLNKGVPNFQLIKHQIGTSIVHGWTKSEINNLVNVVANDFNKKKIGLRLEIDNSTGNNVVVKIINLQRVVSEYTLLSIEDVFNMNKELDKL